MKFVKRNTTKGSEGSNVTIKTGGYSNSSSSSSFSLTSHNIWGQPFDGTNDVTGDMQNVGSITATGNIQTDGDIIIKQLDTDGNEIDGGDFNLSVEDNSASFSGKEKYAFDGDIEGKNVKVDGNLNVTGTTNVNDLKVDGDATFNSNIEVKGDSKLNNVTSNNITNSDTIKTKNLEVTGSAHFFELIIDKIKAAGGAALFTPADGFDIDIVKSVGTSGYKLYWQCRDGNGKQRDNMWKVNDQALCMSFNQAKVGTSHNVSNKYYWCLVTDVSDNLNPTLIDGEYYHYIVISSNVCDGNVNPEKGDSIVMCGYRGTDDTSRQSAIYISAYSSLDSDLIAPLFAQYRGINDFNLSSHRKSYFDANKAKFVGDFSTESGTTFDDLVTKVDNISKSDKMISSQDYYLLSDKNTGITLGTSGWTTTYTSPTETQRYLWKCTKYHYDYNNDVWSNPIIVAEYIKATNGKDAEYYMIEYTNKILSVYVDDNNTNGILKCAIKAYIYKVKGNVKQLQTDKGLALYFYNSKGTLVTSANADTSNPYERDYTNTVLQKDYLTNTNQIVYCIAETYDL